MAKVLFQSMNPRLFRAIFIGYLYEIAQKHEVVLLTEKIDPDTQKILQDTNLFPGLKEIILFESAFYGDIFRKNYRLWRTLKKAVRDYRPDIVIAHSDFWPADMYVLRLTKRAGAITVAMQAGFKIAGERKLYQWSSLLNSHLNVPHVLPFFLRLFLVKMKKYAGHFLYYWILPLTMGEKPFWGKTSFVFWDEASGLRDADYSVVFSKRDYDLCRKDGVAREKLFVIGHPLEHAPTKRFFEEVYFPNKRGKTFPGTGNRKVLTIMWPYEKIGFKELNHSLIAEKEMQENRAGIVKLISKKLPDWKIFIKPHPALENISQAQKRIGQIPENVSVVEPTEPADTYIKDSSVIVGMPLASTTLFSASKQDSQKIVLSLNLHAELLGDVYKDFNGIEYIDSEEQCIRVLDAIGNGTYQKQNTGVSNFDFANASELVDYVYDKRIY